MPRLPQLSRFELQCLRRLWTLGQCSVRELHGDLDDPPSYSTVRKIVERLEEKGAVARVRREGKAWIYRPAVPRSTMVRQEVQRFLDLMFDGSAVSLVSHLTEVEALSVEDLREIDRSMSPPRKKRAGATGSTDRKRRPG